jgi:KRAB domain-containing zinc finger protein
MSHKHKSICRVCSKEIVKENLEEHMMTVHLKSDHRKPFVCDYCSKKFVFKYRLRTHLRAHVEEKLFNCDCGQGFNYKQQFDDHMLAHQEKVEQPYRCDLCPGKYKRKQVLEVRFL